MREKSWAKSLRAGAAGFVFILLAVMCFPNITAEAAWQKGSGGWWYSYGSTYCRNGIYSIGGKRYFFDANGWMKTGWQRINGYWYYFEPSGEMRFGWLQSGSTWYYLDKNNNGRMLYNTTRLISGQYYSFDSSGRMRTGWYQNSVSKAWYYFDGRGAMVRGGWKQISGRWYYFNSKGVRQTGWLTVSGKKYYLASNGVMVTGTQKINGRTYVFGSDGALKSTVSNASSVVTTAISANKKYSVDLDGDGIREIFHYKVSGGTCYLYVNNSPQYSDKTAVRPVVRLHRMGTNGYFVEYANNKGTNSITPHYWMRYNGSKFVGWNVSKTTGATAGMITPINANRFTVLQRGSFGPIGRLYWREEYSVSKTSLSKTQKLYPLLGLDAQTSRTTWTAIRSFYVYTAPGSGKAAFRVNAGDKVTIRYVYVSGGNVYARVTKGSQSGYLYLPKYNRNSVKYFANVSY